jgi:hypothetical protein
MSDPTRAVPIYTLIVVREGDPTTYYARCLRCEWCCHPDQPHTDHDEAIDHAEAHQCPGDAMTEPHLPTKIKRGDVEVEHFTAPGQSVTAGPLGVRIRHIPTQVTAEASSMTSRLQNLELAYGELRGKLIDAGHLAPLAEFPIDEAIDAAARVRFFRAREDGHAGHPDEDHLSMREAWEKYADVYRAAVRHEVVAAATPIEAWVRRGAAAEMRKLYRPMIGGNTGPDTAGPPEPTEWDEAIHACVEIMLAGLDGHAQPDDDEADPPDIEVQRPDPPDAP